MPLDLGTTFAPATLGDAIPTHVLNTMVCEMRRYGWPRDLLTTYQRILRLPLAWRRHRVVHAGPTKLSARGSHSPSIWFGEIIVDFKERASWLSLERQIIAAARKVDDRTDMPGGRIILHPLLRCIGHCRATNTTTGDDILSIPLGRCHHARRRLHQQSRIDGRLEGR